MTLKVSARATEIPPFFVMEVMRAAHEREMSKEAVYHMEVGQPGAGAPEGALLAAEAALRDQRLGYTDALGAPEIRSAISRWYRTYYGLDVAPERIVVTTGSSGAFVLTFLAAFDVGDRVALASPGYPCYRNILSALGIRPVSLMTTAADRFQPTPALLDRALADGPLDGLIVASPSNPTGTMLDRDTLRDLASYCREKGIRLISDEIYHGITFGRKADSALSFTRDAVVVNSFSKYFSMTGWRLGWMVVPAELSRAIECLSQNLFISPPALSQIAGMAALECREEIDRNVAGYARSRELLLEALPRAGFDRLAPADGAFYLYADITNLTNDSEAFCRRMLAETGVAATPGIDFDPDRGNTFMRFSFSRSTAEMNAAAEALIAWQPR
ncbi:MAG: aminotransferase class I/II-fold pyridoxal phosphate-dependent enzyme [Alphaproteobacteria bacterium]